MTETLEPALPSIHPDVAPSGRPDIARLHQPPPIRAVAIALILVMLADLLFWQAEAGLSLALYALALMLGAMAMAPATAVVRRGAALAITVLAALPVVEHVQALSVLILAIGVAIAALVAAGRVSDLRTTIERCVLLPVGGLVWLVRDLRGLPPSLRRLYPGRETAAAVLARWALPVLAVLVFGMLFVQANPVIEHWALALGDVQGIEVPDGGRIALWIVAVLCIWPLLMVQVRPLPKPAEARRAQSPPPLSMPLDLPGVTRASILRTLIVCNLVFAVQTTLDLSILWGGIGLPAGMTYAEYAHRGAYPLVGAALLAGAFVILATTLVPPTPAIRALIHIWVAQTLVLLASSVHRLVLYVEAFGLTHLRVAAFVWMALVAVGLVLILIRVQTRRSNGWLIRGNLIALAVALYGMAFVNVTDLIARHNLAHSAPAVADGPPLDGAYLCRLGPQILPAVRDYQATGFAFTCAGPGVGPQTAVRSLPTFDPPQTWQGWTLRMVRLHHALASMAGAGEGAEGAAKAHQ